MKLHFVDQMDEVLTLALESPLIALAEESDVLTVPPPTEISTGVPARQ
jgi:hypothetical protein